jgi:hypothetical protein
MIVEVSQQGRITYQGKEIVALLLKEYFERILAFGRIVSNEVAIISI